MIWRCNGSICSLLFRALRSTGTGRGHLGAFEKFLGTRIRAQRLHDQMEGMARSVHGPPADKKMRHFDAGEARQPAPRGSKSAEDEARNMPGLRQRVVDYLYSSQVGPMWNDGFW